MMNALATRIKIISGMNITEKDSTERKVYCKD